MNKTKTEIVFINSSDATNYNNTDTTYLSDVSFYLSRAITRPKDTVLALRLDTFCFPNSFYTVDTTNYQLDVELGSMGVDYTYYLPEGNYTADELVTELEDLLAGDGYTVAYDSNTNKFTFHNDDDFTIKSTSTCLSILGFSSADHESNMSGDAVSDLVVNLTKTKVIYVDVQNLSINNLNASTGQRTTALTCVPVSSSSGDFVFYENTRASYVYLQEDTINNLRIRLYEEDLSTLVNFQGQNWTMSLEFSFLPA